MLTDLNETEIKNLIAGSGLSVLESWVTSDARVGREDEQWLNVLLRIS